MVLVLEVKKIMFNTQILGFDFSFVFTPLSAIVLLIVVLLSILRMLMLRENEKSSVTTTVSTLLDVIVVISLISASLCFVLITFTII